MSGNMESLFIILCDILQLWRKILRTMRNSTRRSALLKYHNQGAGGAGDKNLGCSNVGARSSRRNRVTRS
jgi:hypothetical protein